MCFYLFICIFIYLFTYLFIHLVNYYIHIIKYDHNHSKKKKKELRQWVAALWWCDVTGTSHDKIGNIDSPFIVVTLPGLHDLESFVGS